MSTTRKPRFRRAPRAPQETPRPRLGTSEIWVESPLQLLSAIEAHAAGLTGTSTTVRVRPGIPGINKTADALANNVPQGITIDTESGHITPLSSSPMNRWGAGDMFSGQVQKAMLGTLGDREIIIIDDGLATLAFLDKLSHNSPTPLVRDRGKRTAGRITLGLAAWHRLRWAAKNNRVLLITALPLVPELSERLARIGVRVEHHAFEWSRSQPAEESFSEQTMLIGSALACDGLIEPEPYINWIKQLASDAPLAYFPHRREQGELLEEIRAIPGVNVQATTTPVELRLRGLRPLQRVVSLPSTAVTSLRLLLAGRGIDVTYKRIPDSWWTPQATPALRQHLLSSVSLKQGKEKHDG